MEMTLTSNVHKDTREICKFISRHKFAFPVMHANFCVIKSDMNFFASIRGIQAVLYF
jgi:hypothetical protein